MTWRNILRAKGGINRERREKKRKRNRERERKWKIWGKSFKCQFFPFPVKEEM